MHAEHHAPPEGRQLGIEIHEGALEALGRRPLHRDVERGREGEAARGEAFAAPEDGAHDDLARAAALRGRPAMPRGEPRVRAEERVLGPAGGGLVEIEPVARLGVAAKRASPHAEQEPEVDGLGQLALGRGDRLRPLAGEGRRRGAVGIAPVAKDVRKALARREGGRHAQLDLGVVGDHEAVSRRRPKARPQPGRGAFGRDLLQVGLAAGKSPRVGGEGIEPTADPTVEVHVGARPMGVGRKQLVEPGRARGIRGTRPFGRPIVRDALERRGIDGHPRRLHTCHDGHEPTFEVEQACEPEAAQSGRKRPQSHHGAVGHGGGLAPDGRVVGRMERRRLRRIDPRREGGRRVVGHPRGPLRKEHEGDPHVAESPGLESLDLADNVVADVGPLAAQGTLRSLDLRRNAQLVDIDPLGGLASLVGLDLSATAVADVAALASLPNLAFVDLRNTNLDCAASTMVLDDLHATVVEANAGQLLLDCDLDCAGIWGGPNREDLCGTCDDDPGNDQTLIDPNLREIVAASVGVSPGELTHAHALAVTEIAADDAGIFALDGLECFENLERASFFDNDIGDNNGDGRIDINDLDAAPTQLVVEVSGLHTSAGLVATRIDRVNMAAANLGRPGVAGDELEIKGMVASVAPDGSQFTVNQTVFLVGPGSFFADGLLPNEDLVDVFVEVKADVSAGNFLAVRVEREDDLGIDERHGEFEIEGILDSINTTVTPHRVMIDGLSIPVDDASGLVNLVGARIEIKGHIDADGVVVIRRNRLDAEENARTEDRVAAVDRTAGHFITRLGLVITPTGSARVEDDAGIDGDHLTPGEFLDRLQIDDFIEARGIPGSNADVSWTRIERDDNNDRDCRLRGPVGSIDTTNFSFVILGVTVDTSRVADADFADAADQPIGRDAFFAQLREGEIAQATSFAGDAFCASGMLTARELELAPDDGVVGTVPPRPGDDDPGGNDELAGPVSNVGTNSFAVARTPIGVSADTLIDASLVAAARGVALPPDDLRFGDLPETLAELLPSGTMVSVRIDAAGNAVLIEDRG